MGGAGYIGSHTVKHLLDNGYRVIVADNWYMGIWKLLINGRHSSMPIY